MCASITFFLEARQAFALTCVFDKLWNLEIEKSYHWEKKKTFGLIIMEKKMFRKRICDEFCLTSQRIDENTNKTLLTVKIDM